MVYSNAYEIFFTTGISNLSLFVYNTFLYKNILFEFIFWIYPQYHVIMYPDEKYEVICLLISLINFNKLKINKTDLSQKDLNFRIIRILRSYIACQVAICILGADFQGIFPFKFGKTVEYGFGLMDVGIGSYIYNCGLMINKNKVKTSQEVKIHDSSKVFNKKKIKTSFFSKNIAILFILGIIRYLTILFFNLHVEITEYGKQSNFYFILGLLQIVFKLFPYNKLGYFLLFFYQIITRYYKIDKFIFNDNRNGFLFQNKETFFIIIPFLCLMMIVQDISRILFYEIDNPSKKKLLCQKIGFSNLQYKIYNLSKYLIIFGVFYYFFSLFELPSRRLCNATYIFYILFIHTAHIFIYILISIVTDFHTYKSLDFVSKNMMSNFIITNLLVLVFKKLITFNNEKCHAIMMLYLSVSFILPPLFFK